MLPMVAKKREKGPVMSLKGKKGKAKLERRHPGMSCEREKREGKRRGKHKWGRRTWSREL